MSDGSGRNVILAARVVSRLVTFCILGVLIWFIVLLVATAEKGETAIRTAQLEAVAETAGWSEKYEELRRCHEGAPCTSDCSGELRCVAGRCVLPKGRSDYEQECIDTIPAPRHVSAMAALDAMGRFISDAQQSGQLTLSDGPLKLASSRRSCRQATPSIQAACRCDEVQLCLPEGPSLLGAQKKSSPGERWAQAEFCQMVCAIDAPKARRAFQQLAVVDDPLRCAQESQSVALEGAGKALPLELKSVAWKTRIGRLVTDLNQETKGLVPPSVACVLTSTTDTKAMVAEAFDKNWGTKVVRTTLVLLVAFAGVVLVLYLLAFLRLYSIGAGWIGLLVLSFPAFAVALYTKSAAGRFLSFTYNDPGSDDLAMQLTVVASIVAGGVTFDVGRRLLLLIDELKDSPPIRGLEHFGKRFVLLGPFELALAVFRHMKLTFCDFLGVRGGLAEADELEHFVVRAAEYRALEYLSARGAYLVDNLLVLGIIFGAPLITEDFVEALRQGKPALLVGSMTAVIGFSVGLRILITVIHARLFPGIEK